VSWAANDVFAGRMRPAGREFETPVIEYEPMKQLSNKLRLFRHTLNAGFCRQLDSPANEQTTLHAAVACCQHPSGPRLKTNSVASSHRGQAWRLSHVKNCILL